MTPGELIAKLRGDGITLRRDGESLRVTSNTGKIHAEIKSLILENKPALLEYLGSAAPGDGLPASSPDVSSALSSPSEPPYRSYTLPDGSVLALTREEFEGVVAVFRMLWRQDQRNQEKGRAAKKAA